MQTFINGTPVEWTDAIRTEWDAQASGRPAGTVLTVNYFTPRPYVDAYNRGDIKTGFVYTLKRHQYAEPEVLYVTWYTDEDDKRIYTQMVVMEPRR